MGVFSTRLTGVVDMYTTRLGTALLADNNSTQQATKPFQNHGIYVMVFTSRCSCHSASIQLILSLSVLIAAISTKMVPVMLVDRTGWLGDRPVVFLWPVGPLSAPEPTSQNPELGPVDPAELNFTSRD